MITVTANAFHERLHIGEEEIVLNGPPASMSGQVFLRNKENETLFIRDLPFVASAQVGVPRSIRLITSLLPGEEKKYKLKYKLPRSTPPGIYEGIMQAGGKEKKLKLIVQQHIEIDVYPLTIFFQGVVPGQSYSTELSFTNNGNIPFKIPESKHATTLDADYLCRAASLAMREKGGEGFTAMMDELTKNVHKDMADWVRIHIEESGRVIQPGESTALHLSVTLPKDVDPKRDYLGNVRFWDKTLSYSIKSHEDILSGHVVE
jgi:hypothetical protein